MASKKVVLLAISSSIAMVGISYMKAALELEDAEQAYYSQWWRWGYDDQPPLYTWLQIIFNSIFGVSKLSFALLRGLIFAGTLVMVYRFALAFLKDGSKAVLVVLSLSLIPVFIDLTFRRLSHTSLLILVVMATYLIIQRIRYRRTVLNYMLLGLLIGMGVLTKYNYGLFLGGLFLLLFVDTAFRKTVFNSRILVTLILVVLLVLPHFYWLV
ncbi:MAG: glycosyltransferase family 39 protein, partial [Bacteroidota bacterium]